MNPKESESLRIFWQNAPYLAVGSQITSWAVFGMGDFWGVLFGFVFSCILSIGFLIKKRCGEI